MSYHKMTLICEVYSVKYTDVRYYYLLLLLLLFSGRISLKAEMIFC